MRPNETRWDRMARSLIGLVALTTASAVLEPGVPAGALAIVGSILIVTGLAGWCRLYDVLGFRTRGPRPTNRVNP